MQVFSKPLRQDNPITYEQFVKTPQCLRKLKIDDLKASIRNLSTKAYRIPMHGAKIDLIYRLEHFFHQQKCAIRIQRRFRCFLFQQAYRISGRMNSQCVNDTDFYTLDPLREIPYPRHFSYRDENGFLYGFDVFSLMNLFQRERHIRNPYTREILSASETHKILTLYHIIHLIFPEVCEEELHVFPTRREMVEKKLRELSTRPVARRIDEVFMHIDYLGNYTQSIWFSRLTKLQYAFFYESYYSWWTNRSGLSSSLKRDICYVENPFSDIRQRPVEEVSREEYQFACLELMEYMVYTGKDEECQRLGAMHVLTQLTGVSHWARASFPWLYESFRFFVAF